MKLLPSLFTIISLLSCLSVQAQLGQGVIEYEYRMDMHRNIPPEREDFKAMIPQFHEQRFELIFNEKESIFKVKEDHDAPMSAGRGGMRISMQMPTALTYVDREKREVLIQQDLLGRTYLISEPLAIGSWRVGHEMMEIAGYMCMMAWMEDTVLKQEITAWFTPELGLFMGPDRYVNLPGTVLALDVNNGERVWVARKINGRDISAREITAPNRGERISRENFMIMMREQTERMQSRGMVFPF